MATTGSADERVFIGWVDTMAGMLAAFLPPAFLVHKTGGGVAALWLAVGVWMAARLTTLGLRLRA